MWVGWYLITEDARENMWPENGIKTGEGSSENDE